MRCTYIGMGKECEWIPGGSDYREGNIVKNIE